MTEQKEAQLVDAICTSLTTKQGEWKIVDTFSPQNRLIQIYIRKELEIRPAGGLIIVKNKGVQIHLSSDSQLRLASAIKKIESWALEKELNILMSNFGE